MAAYCWRRGLNPVCTTFRISTHLFQCDLSKSCGALSRSLSASKLNKDFPSREPRFTNLTCSCQYFVKDLSAQIHRTNSNTCVRFLSSFSTRTDLTYEELVALVDSRDIQMIDVRESKEIEDTGAFPNAINIPLGNVKGALMMDDVAFEERYKFSKPQKYDANIVFVGFGPIKSSAALEIAHKIGFKKSRHYVGGYEEWMKLRMK